MRLFGWIVFRLRCIKWNVCPKHRRKRVVYSMGWDCWFDCPDCVKTAVNAYAEEERRAMDTLGAKP